MGLLKWIERRRQEQFEQGIMAAIDDPPGPYREVAFTGRTGEGDLTEFFARAFRHADGTAHVMTMSPPEAAFSGEWDSICEVMVTQQQLINGESPWFEWAAPHVGEAASLFTVTHWRAKG